MHAGRELDAVIAARVFGYTLDYEFADMEMPPAPHVKELRDGYDEWGVLPYYSTDIGDAWAVVEHFRAFELRTYTKNIHKIYCLLWGEGLTPPTGSAIADTAPLAICLAALAALDAAYTPDDG